MVVCLVFFYLGRSVIRVQNVRMFVFAEYIRAGGKG